jgi:predicted ATP-dependent endonuclease of OLD family
MITFKEFIKEEITEEEIDALIESLEWEDVIHLFDEEDMIVEDISAKERIKKSQKLKSRKVLMALARKVKLKRSATLGTLKNRTKTDARRMIMKKMLKGRSKKNLSATEKNSIEARTSKVMTMMNNLPTKLLPKVRQLQRDRLIKGKK